MELKKKKGEGAKEAKKAKEAKEAGEKEAEEPKEIKHLLVPNASVADEKELNELFKKHEISRENLPVINSNDPAVVVLNATAGDVIRFERTNPFDVEEIFYRLVI